MTAWLENKAERAAWRLWVWMRRRRVRRDELNEVALESESERLA